MCNSSRQLRTLFLAGADLDLPLWSVAPFADLLLSVAVLPLVAHDWWHRNRNKTIVSLLFGVPIAIYIGFQTPGAVLHALVEYLAFISLLGSLYIISGGVRLKGSLPGTPASNAALLAFGAVLANVAGTTGPAMLLLRPYLNANRSCQVKVRLVVFFILVVANCGGCLTPLGDPPLFLGFLKGVSVPLNAAPVEGVALRLRRPDRGLLNPRPEALSGGRGGTRAEGSTLPRRGGPTWPCWAESSGWCSPEDSGSSRTTGK